jgi:hypothetical protein
MLREDCHETSGYSYLRVMTIRINVHPVGKKPDTHDTCAFHVSPRMPHVRCLRAVYVHGNLS